MREIDYMLDGIFGGISPSETNPKGVVRLLECHNVEPDSSVPENRDYKLHEVIVDLDADGYTWNPAAGPPGPPVS